MPGSARRPRGPCRGAPVPSSSTGFAVSLWERLAHDPDKTEDALAVGRSLGRLHEALAACGVLLPSFRVGLDRARVALEDPELMCALAPADRAWLRAAFDELLSDLNVRNFEQRALHGEPHDANRLSTPDGVRWIDLEAACHGPLEWDLAFLDADACEGFTRVDRELLGLLRVLNSARVATWCWARARFPTMRWHARHHLEQVRHWRESMA